MKKLPKAAAGQEDQLAKRGRGRPPVESEKKRTETILVRFTPQEQAAIDSVADENGKINGMTLGVWLRNLALRAIGFKPKPPESKRE